MALIIILITLFLLYTSLLLPWSNRSRLKNLEKEITILRHEYAKIKNGTTEPSNLESNIDTNLNLQEDQVSEEYQFQAKMQDKGNSSTPPLLTKSYTPDAVPSYQEPIAEGLNSSINNFEADSEPKVSQASESNLNFEQQFGAKLPVWIGGIALALAGFFLVKYSLEKNLISHTMRMCISTILGFSFLFAAKFIRNKPDFANGSKIAQSLTGAGIAVLYFTSYASVRLYHLLPSAIGFTLMALVTATALILSLRHGAAIALMGMLGGFLTPILMHGNTGNSLALFIYLYFTAAGLLFIARKSNWLWLSILTVVISWLWVIAWLFGNYASGDGIILGIFLLSLSATILLNSSENLETDLEINLKSKLSLSLLYNLLSIAGSIIIMALIVGQSGFGIIEWGLYALFAIASIVLAAKQPSVYGYAPVICAITNALMLYTWNPASQATFLNTFLIFVSIYIISSHILIWYSKKPTWFAYLIAICSVGYFFLGYQKLDPKQIELLSSIPSFWGIAALLIAICFIINVGKIYKYYINEEFKAELLAIFSLLASFFLTLALYIEIDPDFLAVAIATEIFAIAVIYTKLNLHGLRLCITYLSYFFAILLLPQVLLLAQLSITSIFGSKSNSYNSLSILQLPIFQLGLPAFMFFISSYFLRKKQDDSLIKSFEYSSFLLFSIMTYYLLREFINPGSNLIYDKASFLERGIITNTFFILGLFSLYFGKIYTRSAFVKSGSILCLICILRICFFDLFDKNPLWHAQKIDGGLIFNTLLLAYGFPIIWTSLASKLEELKQLGFRGVFMLVLLFTLISLNVRFAFHGEYLNNNYSSNAEIYTYSVAWLLLGISLLAIGISKKAVIFRHASLVIILLTVAKVFLYDTSELEGLFRVFSFLGLGLSLIGLSYFYTKFVFKNEISNK